MAKLDLKKDHKQLYTASKDHITLVDVPPAYYLMAEGQGAPNAAPAFQEATETLFRLSHTLKFMLKKAQGLDWAVMPLEGLWDAEDLTAYTQGRKAEWRWTLMIRQPDFVTSEHVARALEGAAARKNTPPLYATTFGRLAEGLSAQVLHLGPYAAEAIIISRLHTFIKEKGYHFGGKHHEIYLSDPRRTAPEKLRTILRQPITLEAMK